MDYEKLLQEVAKRYGVNTAEIRSEMEKALKLSGVDLPPDEFIKLCSDEAIRKIITDKSKV